MSNEMNLTMCSGCGKDLTYLNDPNDPHKRAPCPDCGSKIRNHFASVECGIKLTPSISLEAKNPEGFTKQKEKVREDYSEKSGRPVTITKVIDRTNLDITTFYHKVEEYDEHGILKKVVHEHTNISPAKHRNNN